MKRAAWSVAIALACLGGRAYAVTISEIHYHPPAGSEILEFVEIANDQGTPEDISGWAFVEGVRFMFAPGTILPARGFLVVALDPAALKGEYGITNVVGPFGGRLNSSGDRVTLVNHAGRPVVTLRYDEDGKWPVGPDGTGHTLALRSLHLDPGEPESWAPSAELGGTPGKTNFNTVEAGTVDHVLIDRRDEWLFRKGTAPFSSPATAWREPDFDDSGWTPGPSGFGYGDDDDATVLNDMLNAYTSVAVRKRFRLEAAELEVPGQFFLGIDFDDGFIAYLNGREVTRTNAGAPGEERAHSASATGARERGPEDFHVISRDLLLEGDNVLAIVGFNAGAGSSDFSLVPRLLRRETLDAGAAPPVFNELFRAAAPGSSWVELYNPGRTARDLTGYLLTDDPERLDPYPLPEGTRLPAGGFLRIGEAESGLVLSAPRVQVFLLDPQGMARAAVTFDRLPPPGAPPAGYSECRLPDGGLLDWVSTRPTPGAPNDVERTTGVIINEIFYHPPEERPGEFIELYNRSQATVDLSGWYFDRGIDLVIPAGTQLAPGAYLVVAEDPALMAESYGLQGVVGPWRGRLADSGEKVRLLDRSGNPVDEVRYHEGGAWSDWADGGGSSLELVDPLTDNSVGAAWEASDETDKAPWEEWAFRVQTFVPAGESELWIYLQEQGACLIDDVSITRAGGQNFIPNPGFEAGTSSWAFLGTHLHSGRITTDSHSGSACLELEASGKGDTLANRIETDTAPRLSIGSLDVSLWVRWRRGGSLLVVQAPYTAGSYSFHPSPATNMSGNALSLGRHLAVPFDLGTPGAENSVTRKLREATGQVNLGPLISEVGHRPVSPLSGQPVQVTARISDPQGVTSAAILYRQGSAGPDFTRVPLLDDGLSGDGDAGDGLYGGEITALAASTRVVFYVEATDAQGSYRQYPLDAPAHTCLYQVHGPVGIGTDAARIILDTQRAAELSGRPLHSNDLVDGTFVINDEEVYYNVGVRYRGSPWGRPGRNNYRVRFQEDHPFRRGRKKINLDNSGGGPNEGAAYFLHSRVSSPDKPVPTMEYSWVRTWFNGQDIGLHGLLQPVDRDFVETWYGSAEVAQAWKVEGRRVLDDAGGLTGWDGMTFVHRGPDAENYRGYLIPAIRQSVDDWSEVALLTRTMDARTTPLGAFDAAVGEVVDVEQFLRCLAPRILYADWDAFCIGNGHNGYLILDPSDQRWELLPFDMDNTFGSTSPNLFPTFDPSISRFMSRPEPKRIYYRILDEYVQGYWSADNAGPYLDAVQAAAGVGTSGIKSFLTTTGTAVKNTLASVSNLPFRIITMNGGNFATPNAQVDLEGEAPVQVASILHSVNGGDQVPLEAAWTTPTRWKATFPLAQGPNAFLFIGFDASAFALAVTGLTVTRGTAPEEPKVDSWTPQQGGETGGTRVTLTGRGFAAGMQVLFARMEGTDVVVVDGTTARVSTPAAPRPFPTGGTVDVEVVLSATSRLVFPRGFTYLRQKRFLRGDSNMSNRVDIGDGLQTLFHLFAGQELSCPDAADFNDSGVLDIADVIATLDYLYRNGGPPAAPFPSQGLDNTADPYFCY